ncbi:MAG: tyrosine-type recombinase/integrase [Roseburia sp.]|nr:tyrosine-type recombinase/integrase [Roseburia sp.]
MNTAQPIKDLEDLEHFKQYYMEVKPKIRNHVLTLLGLNTALRISDILALRWKDVYNFSTNHVLDHICLVEKKTKKKSSIYINDNIRQELVNYKDVLEKSRNVEPEGYLFLSQKNMPLSRSQAWRIVKEAAKNCEISGTICPHSMRKTFGYHAWKQGVQPALLMDVYNHSSFKITRRYLGIGQDDRDEVFKNISL